MGSAGSLRKCAWDSEVMRWWKPPAERFVYAASIVGDEDTVLSVFPLKDEAIRSSTGRTARNITYSPGNGTNDELFRASAYLKHQTAKELRGFRLRVTQNGLGYDYPVLDAAPGMFLVNHDNSGPESIPFRRGIIDSHGRKASGDAIDMDMMWMARHYLGPFVTDYKLETIAAFCDKFFSLDLHFKKSLTYEQQAQMTERALEGEEESMRTLLEYAYDDSIHQLKAAEPFLNPLMRIAEACHVTYFEAFNESPKSVAARASDRKHFSALHKPRWRGGDGAFDADTAMDSSVKSHKYWTPTIGEARDVLVAAYPYAHFLEPVLEGDAPKKELFGLCRGAKNPIEAFMYSLVLDGWAGEVLADLASVQRHPEQYLMVRARYGKSVSEVESALESRLRKAPFDGATILNKYRNVYFLRGISEAEAARRGFIPFGMADVLSVEAGKAIYRLHGELCSAGIDIPSRKEALEEPGKMRRSALETRTLRAFLEHFFDDKKAAWGIVCDAAKNLAEHKTPPEELLRRLTVHTLPENMGVQQQLTRTGRILRAFPEAQLGESIVYLLGEGPNDEAYLRYDPGEREFGVSLEPAWKTYQEEIFGRNAKRESTFFSIAHALAFRGTTIARERVKNLEKALREGDFAKLSRLK